MTLDEVYQRLKEEGIEIGKAARAGDKKARHVVEMYQLHYTCPSDPGAQALLVVAYEEYSAGRQGGVSG